MDILEHQKARDSDLAEFQHTYSELKTRYGTLLNDAIYEKDIQAQAAIVNQILQVNTELASEVRAFISKSEGKPYDPTILQQLTDDLIKYQQEYDEIKKSEDMEKTLDMIMNQQKHQLDKVITQFNWMMGLLILAIIVVLYLVFSTSTSVFTTVGQAVSQTLTTSQV